MPTPAGYRKYSVEDMERFWDAVVEDMGIEFSRPWDAVSEVSRGVPLSTPRITARRSRSLARSSLITGR